MKELLKTISTLFIVFIFINYTNAQEVPGKEQKFLSLITTGQDALSSFGDDDHNQTYFFVVPESYSKPFYVRIFDPEISGKNDLITKKTANTSSIFSVYGGKQAYSNKNARGIDPKGEYKSGVLLSTKTFKNEAKYDNQWFAIGPINPKEGEFDKELKGYVFKIICEGGKGDDGNLYSYFFSSKKDENSEIEGGNSFTYEVSFRLLDEINSKSHLYPFISSNIVAITEYNFDFDNDCKIKMNSISKNDITVASSGDNVWNSATFNVTEDEKNSSLDVQFVKSKTWSNDVTFYLVNQYNEAIPMFSSPIGGKPKYKYKVDIIIQNK